MRLRIGQKIVELQIQACLVLLMREDMAAISQIWDRALPSLC